MAVDDITELCTSNATLAAQHGQIDLVQAWSTAALVADLDLPVPQDPDAGTPWPQHPFGRELIRSL